MEQKARAAALLRQSTYRHSRFSGTFVVRNKVRCCCATFQEERLVLRQDYHFQEWRECFFLQLFDQCPPQLQRRVSWK